LRVLIDADIVAYRASFSAEELEQEDAEHKVDEVMDYILEKTTFDGQPYKAFLTGSGNFRYELATIAPYKGNRRDTAKPRHLEHMREYLVDAYEAVVSSGEEADDLIAIEATEIGPSAIIASVDKDFLQVPCRMYNFGKDQWFETSEFEGLQFFYTQCLEGDRADNIKGVAGIGPKKAAKILDGATTELELWERCLGAHGGDRDALIENARLLWLRREVGQLWQPPTEA
jgi:5'-3' exonuclease